LQSKPMTELLSPDYARFSIDNGKVIPGERMKKKLAAIPLPDFAGKTVLDVGCDYGQFSFWAAMQGAKEVVGLDRNREVRGLGRVNLVDGNNTISRKHFPKAYFREINLGKQWHEFGKFDHVLMFSMYHHVFENVGQHLPIWFWLWRHGGVVLWENPVDLKDVVSDRHISGEKRQAYSRDEIFRAAEHYFSVEHIGPALHEPNREVYRLTPKELTASSYAGVAVDGAGGASKAFRHADFRRSAEIGRALGFMPYPGSLNIRLDRDFDWARNYYRTQILDVKDRAAGLDSEWAERWCRFYPVEVNGIQAHAMRFEGESYHADFIEVVAPMRLRSFLPENVQVTQ
jgi:SAM-dependent methyltransferase